MFLHLFLFWAVSLLRIFFKNFIDWSWPTFSSFSIRVSIHDPPWGGIPPIVQNTSCDNWTRTQPNQWSLLTGDQNSFLNHVPFKFLSFLTFTSLNFLAELYRKSISVERSLFLWARSKVHVSESYSIILTHDRSIQVSLVLGRVLLCHRTEFNIEMTFPPSLILFSTSLWFLFHGMNKKLQRLLPFK